MKKMIIFCLRIIFQMLELTFSHSRGQSYKTQNTVSLQKNGVFLSKLYCLDMIKNNGISNKCTSLSL